MKRKLFQNCPACSGEIIISKLKCKDCELEISGDFDFPTSVEEVEENEFQALSKEELSFIKQFLKVEGNISKMQTITGENYNSIKSNLSSINVKLGNIEKGEIDMIDVNTNESKVIRTLKEKIFKAGGKALMPVLKGDPVPFWLSYTQEGFESAGLKNFVFEWKVFDAIIKKANSLGGKMYRGDSAAQSGARIGSIDLPIDTIDGFISTEFYGAQIGDTTLRRSTYYSGILAWAGIVTNHRSQGQGGFITVNYDFRD